MQHYHYCYVMKDPRTQQPFYVGKGSGDRVYRHVWCINSESRKKHTNPIRNKRIREILNAGLKPSYKIIRFVTEQQAFDNESKLIKKYGLLVNGTGILTNMQPGGSAPPVLNRKPVYQFSVTGQLIRTFLSAEEAAFTISVTGSSIRIACNPKLKQGIRIGGFLWSYLSVAPTLKNHKERRVMQFTLQGQHVKTFATLRQAAKSVGLQDTSGIVKVCRQRAKTAGGFLWRYK